MDNHSRVKEALRRLACVLLAAMLAFAVPMTTASAAKGKTYVCTVKNVRVRPKPRPHSEPVVTKLAKGQKVVHIGTHKGWWRIRTADNKVGWVYKTYLRRANIIQVGKTYRAKTAGVKIYSRPRTSASVRGRMGRKTKVVLLARKGKWGMVRELKSGKVGYVQLKYLQMV